MDISNESAAERLAMIDGAATANLTMSRYSASGDTLVIWGLIWFICNAVEQFLPAAARGVWLVATAFGISASFLLRKRHEGGPWQSMRSLFLMTSGASWLFTVLVVVSPHSGAEVTAIISLCVAWTYVVTGNWIGVRYTGLGLALALLILIGWYLLHGWFFGWMAVVGGGTLVAGGVWLRRA